MVELRLKELLKQKNILSKALANKIGVTETSMSQIVNGGFNPSLATLSRIAIALDVDIRELFVGSRETESDDLLDALIRINRIAERTIKKSRS